VDYTQKKVFIVGLETGKKPICYYIRKRDEKPGRQAEDGIGYEWGYRLRKTFEGQHKHEGDADPNHSAVDEGS
jgi:hypothetical protein